MIVKNSLKNLKNFKVPIAVNFTQAAGVALADLLESKKNGEMGEMLGADVIVTYPSWPRYWQNRSRLASFQKRRWYDKRSYISFHFFYRTCVRSSQTNLGENYYPKDPLLCETAVLAKLENKDGLPVNIFSSVGGMQPDRQEFTVKGSKASRKVAEFYKDSISTGDILRL